MWNAPYTAQLLEKFNGTVGTARGALDHQQRRKKS